MRGIVPASRQSRPECASVPVQLGALADLILSAPSYRKRLPCRGRLSKTPSPAHIREAGLNLSLKI